MRKGNRFLRRLEHEQAKTARRMAIDSSDVSRLTEKGEKRTKTKVFLYLAVSCTHQFHTATHRTSNSKQD